jgi:hypothetical protein
MVHADHLRPLRHLQVQLAQVEAEGAASDVQAVELTAQLKQARAEVQEATRAAEARQQAEAERRGRGGAGRGSGQHGGANEVPLAILVAVAWAGGPGIPWHVGRAIPRSGPCVRGTRQADPPERKHPR